MAEKFDVIIVGAGPAGLSAAIYASRARLRTLVLDESVPGGQMKTTHKVSNYPGFPEDVKGTDLAKAFATQAERFGAKIRRAVEITKHDLKGDLKTFELDEEEQVETPAVIVATVTAPKAVARRRGATRSAGPLVLLADSVRSAIPTANQSLFLSSRSRRKSAFHSPLGRRTCCPPHVTTFARPGSPGPIRNWIPAATAVPGTSSAASARPWPSKLPSRLARYNSRSDCGE